MSAARPWIQACRPDRAFLAPCCVAVGSAYARFDAQDGPGLPAHLLVTVGSFAAAVGLNALAHAWRDESSSLPANPLSRFEAAVGGGIALALAGICAVGLVPLSGAATAGFGVLALLVATVPLAPVVGFDVLGRGHGALAYAVAFGPLAALAGFASQTGTGSWGCVVAGVPAGLVAAGALEESRVRATDRAAPGSTPGLGVALPLLAAAAAAIVARAGEYPPRASLAVVPLAVAALLAWRSSVSTASAVAARGERVAIACAVLALGVIVAALRYTTID